MREYALFVLPLALVALLVVVYQGSNPSSNGNIRTEVNLLQTQVHSNESPSLASNKKSPGSEKGIKVGDKSSAESSGDDDADDNSSCGCPLEIMSKTCSVAGGVVLGGVDVVQYFSFKNSDGTYDMSQVGQAGIEDYSSSFQGFTYYFLTADNKATFDANPSAYAPQYGGFCSWGVGYESCPPFAWSATCLGPSGNWALWTIQHEKLYFFYAGDAKDKFLEDPDTYIAHGNARWARWFGDGSESESESDESVLYGHMSTECFVNPHASSTDDGGSASSSSSSSGGGAGPDNSNSNSKASDDGVNSNSNNSNPPATADDGGNSYGDDTPQPDPNPNTGSGDDDENENSSHSGDSSHSH